MLDPQHRHLELVLNAQQHPTKSLLRLVVQARRRLVKQQERRLHRQRASQAHDFLTRIWQLTRWRVGHDGKVEKIEHRLDRVALDPVLAPHRPPVQGVEQRMYLEVGVPPEHHVVTDGQISKQLRVLKRARHAGRGNLVNGPAGQVQRSQSNAAGSWPVKAAHTIEQAGFASAIRTDQRHQLSGADIQVDVVQRGAHTAKT